MTHQQRARRLKKIIRQSREMGLSPGEPPDTEAIAAAVDELKRKAAGAGAAWVAHRGAMGRPFWRGCW